MKSKEAAEVKKALQYIKIARSSDYVTYNMMLGGDTFKEGVIEPLEKICEWNEEDEKAIAVLSKKFAEETKGHTLQEKSEKIGKILAVGGGIAAAIAVAGGIALVAHHKGEKKKRNAEK